MAQFFTVPRNSRPGVSPVAYTVAEHTRRSGTVYSGNREPGTVYSGTHGNQETVYALRLSGDRLR